MLLKDLTLSANHSPTELIILCPLSFSTNMVKSPPFCKKKRHSMLLSRNIFFVLSLQLLWAQNITIVIPRWVSIYFPETTKTKSLVHSADYMKRNASFYFFYFFLFFYLIASLRQTFSPCLCLSSAIWSFLRFLFTHLNHYFSSF